MRCSCSRHSRTNGVVACATELLNSTRGALLVNALLPRGDRRKRGKARGRGFLGEIAAVNHELNERLQRTEFMPFAPVVAEEDAGAVFELGALNGYAARFMTITCAVRPEWRERIPAVIHVDGTAQVIVINRAA